MDITERKLEGAERLAAAIRAESHYAAAEMALKEGRKEVVRLEGVCDDARKLRLEAFNALWEFVHRVAGVAE